MDKIFVTLRDFLNSMPNGYPPAGSGVDIEFLKTVFTEEEAGVFMNLKFKFETSEQISRRAGFEIAYLERILPEMAEKGQILKISVNNVNLYRSFPFVFGIYEFQGARMTREQAELFEKYGNEVFAGEFFSKTPPLMKAIPIGIEVKDNTKIEPYESIAALIEGAKSWSVRDCVCKKEKALLGKKCDKPMEVCLGFAPVEHAFDNDKTCRVISKEETYEILKKSEEAGLVHMTSNFKSGHFYICNCCKCCCGPLSKYISISKNAAAKSNYIAVVDRELCISCGLCLERCQAAAIEMQEYAVIRDCIGCGLCVSTCPAGAVRLEKREQDDMPYVPKNDHEWMELRAASRGIGDDYKKRFF